jgi:hypothetical protein
MNELATYTEYINVYNVLFYDSCVLKMAKLSKKYFANLENSHRLSSKQLFSVLWWWTFYYSLGVISHIGWRTHWFILFICISHENVSIPYYCKMKIISTYSEAFCIYIRRLLFLIFMCILSGIKEILLRRNLQIEVLVFHLIRSPNILHY